LSYECVRELDGCLPDFAGGPVTIRLLPFRSISRTARWANSGHLTWYSIGDPMQRHEGKLEPQGLALSSRRRCLADTNLHQVSANHEFARKALACRQQLFLRRVARHNVAED